MLYIEHNNYKNKYYEVQKKYDEILSEQEQLFLITQPKATAYDKERVNGGSPSNPFEDYLILKEKKLIDERLKEVKAILVDRKHLLDLKEQELRASNDWYDKIYAYYFIDKLSTTKIEKRVPYSRVQIWRILNIIKKNIK